MAHLFFMGMILALYFLQPPKQIKSQIGQIQKLIDTLLAFKTNKISN